MQNCTGGSVEMFNIEGTVRRCDLKLRLEYLGFITTIYCINEDHYAIKYMEGTYSSPLPVSEV